MARWYADSVIAMGIITWSGFREELIEKCGKFSADIREHAGEEFQSLRKQAQINAQDFVKRFILKAFSEEQFYFNSADSFRSSELLSS
ncbi:hypothetical protein [Parasitella parasitica]|uniref:Uncharacterized protein n=1 Tax=Parasitella parasitica TaxID=35722 RepID=A0A0B7NAG2_9FUNG|nr:hypothetical protein [Parasitella parasitica]